MKNIMLIFLCLFLISMVNSQTWPISRTSSVNADIITSPFGPRHPSTGYQLHWGIDISAAERTLVYAVKGGTIKQMGADADGIISVRINHTDGTATEYLHLATDPCTDTDPLLKLIQDGVAVQEGQLIAFSGKSGTPSAHLHLSYYPDNSKYSYRLDTYNPLDILVHNTTDDYIMGNFYWIKGGGDGGLSDQICFDVNVDPRRLDLNKIEISLSEVLSVNGIYLTKEDILTSTKYETNQVAIIDFEGRSNVDYGPRNTDGSSDQEFNGVKVDVASFDNSNQTNYHQYRFKFNCRSNGLSSIRGEIGEFTAEVGDHASYSVSTTPTNIPVFWTEFWPYNTYGSGWPTSITIGNYGDIVIQNSNSSESWHVAATTEMIVESGGMLELENGLNTGSRTWFTLQSPSSSSYKMSPQIGKTLALEKSVSSFSDVSLNSTSSSGLNLWVKSGGTLKLGNYARLENYGNMQLDGTTIISPTDAKIDNYNITISGTVSSGGIGLYNASITANGSPINTSTTTNVNGNFTLYVTSGWTGTVSASLGGYSFNPIPHTSPVTSNITGENFIGTPQTGSITISGTVQMSDNSSPIGVIVSANGTSNDSKVITSGNSYTLTVNFPWTGTITASRAGYTFNSILQTSPVTSNLTGQNLTGTPQSGPTYTIQGYITSDGTSSGTAINGLTLNVTDLNDAVQQSIPVSGKSYTATVLSTWIGKIKPQAAAYNFEPICSLYVNPLSANLTNQNFTGTQIPSGGASIYGISISPTVIPLGQSSVITTISFSNKLKYSRECSYTWGGTNYTGTEATLTVKIDGKYLFVPGTSLSVLYDNYIAGSTHFPIEGAHSYSTATGLSAGRHTYYIETRENKDGVCPWPNACYSDPLCVVSGSFDVINTPPPPSPTLKAPLDGATDVATTPTLEWNPSATATSYILNVGTDPSFQTGVVYDPQTTGTSLPYGGHLKFKTKYYWRVNAINASGQSAWSQVFSFTTVPAIISGTVTYVNAAVSPIGNVVVTLTPATGTALTATSSTVDGTFNILNVSAGAYTLTAVKTTPNTWGGVSIADALWAAQYFVRILPDLGILGREAGDVDKSSAVNSTDAYLIARRSVGISTSFPAGDWVFTGAQPITIDNESPKVYIRGRAMGDVDGSYTPTGTTFQKSSLVQLKSGVDKFAVSASIAAAYGAVGMRIKVTSVKVADISSKLPGFMSNIDDEGVSFGWYAADGKTPVQFEANEEIVTVTLAEKAGNGSSVTIESELVDIQRTELNNNLLVSVQENIPSVFELKQNFPNPFNPSTQIDYDLPQPGIVTLTVYNMLGQEVARLVNEQKNVGSYSVQWAPKNLASGLYIYRIRVQTEKETIMAVKRLMLLK